LSGCDNNWNDRRFGATIDNGRGRNALGLLLALILIEYYEGEVRPGAPEEKWAERQVELIARMNALPDYGIVFGKSANAPPPPGSDEAAEQSQKNVTSSDSRQLDLF
jgi:hypothetical protein